MNTAELSCICKQVRRDIINMTANAGSGHPGGSLSATELMTTLFFRQMRIDPKNPKDPNRDRFVLSKGHSAPCYYAVLAERGFISRTSSPTSASSTVSCRGIPIVKRFRAWTPPPALWDRAAPSLLVWHWVPSIRDRT